MLQPRAKRCVVIPFCGPHRASPAPAARFRFLRGDSGRLLASWRVGGGGGSGAAVDPAPKAVGGVDGGASGHAHFLGAPLEAERESLQQHGHGHDSLHHGELVAHALAHAAAEGDECEVGGHFIWIQRIALSCWSVPGPCPAEIRVAELLLETGRAELIWLAPQIWRPVQIPHANEQVAPLSDGVAAIGALEARGKGVVCQGAADENGWLRVQAQRLRQARPQQWHLPDGLQIGGPAGEGGVHFGGDLGGDVGVLHEEKQRPRQHGGGGLVAGDEHGHQVVAQLAVVHVGAAHVDQEPQQARVSHLGVVPLLESFQVLGLAALACQPDQLIQAVIDHHQVSPELALTWHHVPGKREVPVGDVKRGSVLGLLEQTIHGLDDRGLGGDAAEVVVEHP
mmetsp:Transcript_20111/g.60708  ORF Transcript_20111/g.60708 Transcript_20111/m.60708 type:complete len:395 (+) Transcript_20111:1148-2332(+)